jgi:hypothetical protein
MTIYVHEGLGGFWEADALREAHFSGRFDRRYGEPRYYVAEWLADAAPGATAYVAHCPPEFPPGDVRDPQFELIGPFACPDPSLVEGPLWGWIALYGEPRPPSRLFGEGEPPGD